MNRLQQLIALSFLQLRILLVAIFLLPLIVLNLKLYGFKQTKKIMSRFIPNGMDNITPNEQDLYYAKSVSRMVAIAGNHGVYWADCLNKSLLLWWFLARRGISTEIKFGIENEPVETFGAHAWVEYGGVNICDSEETIKKFSEFPKEKVGNIKFHIEL